MSEQGRRIIKADELEGEGVCVRHFGTGESTTDQKAQQPTVPEVEAEGADQAPEVDRVRRLVQAMLSGFARQRRELLMELQPHVVRIAVEVARRIVRRELRTDPGMVARTVETALEQVAEASQTRVRVHPLDAQVLQSTIREIVSAPDEAAAVEIIPDGSVERGGCVVESDRGIVDARLATQFEEMQTRLMDGLDGTHPDLQDRAGEHSQ